MRIKQLKFQLNNNQIDMQQFMKSTAYLYSYEKKQNSDRQNEQNDQIPANIMEISNKSYDHISCYFNHHRQEIIAMIQSIRSASIMSYNQQTIDNAFDFIHQHTSYSFPVKTTADGNCLFHSISIALYGDESQTFNIKLCAAFIVFENQEFFREVLRSDGDDHSVQHLVTKIATIIIGGNRKTIIAFNLLTLRPIFSYGENMNNSVNTNITFRNDSPICIALKNNYFTAILETPNSICKFHCGSLWH